ncbi:MAG: hypothetical protein ACYC3H_08475 [Bellilinea sp.]
MPKPINPSANPQQPVSCPMCKAIVTKGTLQTHLISLHTKGNTIKGIKLPSSINPYYINCNVCGVQVAKKRLAKHMRKAHPEIVETDLGNRSLSEKVKTPGKTDRNKKKENQSRSSNSHPTHKTSHKTQGMINPTHSTPPGESRMPIIKPFSKKPRPGTVTNTKRALVTKEIYANMVGDWKDIDTSKHHGVSAKNQTGSNESLARQMADDLNARSVRCPICKKMIDRAAYNAHVATAHKTKKSKRRGKGKQVDSHPANRQHNIPPQEYIKDKEMDGSKHLGHHRRESSGQFGSYPLHDDYSDESDAD